jgi:hypothetical protein
MFHVFAPEFFWRLKKRFWGEEVFFKKLASSKNAYVYVWGRGGAFTLNITCDRYSHFSGPGGSSSTLKFDPWEIGSLMDAIAAARLKIAELTKRDD